MSWKIGLHHHWPHDNPRRSTSHCPSHNRLLSEGEGARMSTCKSAGPKALQVWPCKRFPCEGCLQGWWLWLSTITMLAPEGPNCNRGWRDQRPPWPWFPSPSLDHGFEGDRSSLSTVSSMSSMSERSDRSKHSQWGRWHWEERAHMKINLPIFKDEDARDAVTYQSWRWDLMVYQHVGCRDCTLLP